MFPLHVYVQPVGQHLNVYLDRQARPERVRQAVGLHRVDAARVAHVAPKLDVVAVIEFPLHGQGEVLAQGEVRDADNGCGRVLRTLLSLKQSK